MFLDDPSNYLFADEAIASGSSTGWSFPGWPSHLDHILITNELFSEFSNSGSVVQTIKIDDYMSGGLSSYDYYISDHRPVGLKIQVVPAPVSLVEVSNSSLGVFPNPTNGHVSLDLTQCKDAIELKVMDLNGKVIHSMLYQKNQLIDLNFEGPAGIYLLSIESGDKKAVIRLIKE
jgi:hypothetical protein